MLFRSTEVKLDGMRKTIAARLTEAKQSVPHFYLRRDIELDALMAFRAQLNAGLEARGVKLSVNDFIIKACALALQQVDGVLAAAAAAGTTLEATSGHQRLHLVHVDDIVAAFRHAAKRLSAGTSRGHRSYTLPSREAVSLRAIVATAPFDME